LTPPKPFLLTFDEQTVKPSDDSDDRYDMSRKNIASLLYLSSLGLLVSCASSYEVTSSPSGATVIAENVESKEQFTLGQTPLSFKHEDKFGEGFVIITSKIGFGEKRNFIKHDSGAASKLHLVMNPTNEGRGIASVDPDEIDELTEKLLARLEKERERIEQLRLQQEQERSRLIEENLKLEVAKKAAELDGKIEVLNRSLDVYKDSVFSSRHSRAKEYRDDSSRVEFKSRLLSQAQERLNRKDLAGAKTLVDRLLELDEYQPQAHSLKGTIAYLNNDTRQAIRHWERSLELDPKQRQTRQFLLKAYETTGIRLPASLARDYEILDKNVALPSLESDPLEVKLRGP
jgi:hypothetical protein